MSEPGSVETTIGHLFRHEAGRMAAVLTRMLGASHLDDVDDIVQDTLVKAFEFWKIKGLPDNPSAWLFTVARNKAIDLLRQNKHNIKLESALALKIEEEPFCEVWDKNVDDSVLRMMFACCHPAIPVESQIAFTLKTLGGLSVKEIAKAFLTSDETIAKRIYRAKEKFREEKIELVAPDWFDLPARLDSVLKVLYLMFNEGYYSSNPEYVMREDLCSEAVRLAYLLVQHPQVGQPKVKALLALMCLQASRFPARADDQNQIILLEHQDRSKWNRELMQRGFYFLEQASVGDWLSEYHVEAAIASVHATATDFKTTDWQALLKLYDTLHDMRPSNATSLNKAIAMGYAVSPQAGIDALQNVSGLESSHYYHAALGNFFLRLNKPEEAKEHFNKALSLTSSDAESQLILKKIAKCQE